MNAFRYVLLLAAATSTVHGGNSKRADSARPTWRQSAEPVNRSEALRVVLALKRRNMDQLDALFWSISDPRSMGYGNRMSAEAVRALISPGAQAIRAVTEWLKQHGVAQVAVSAHEDYITVDATVGQLEQLFGLQFKVYMNRDGKTLTRSMDKVVIPEQITDVVALVLGIADLPEPLQKQHVFEHDGGDRKVTPKVLMDTYNITGHEPQPIPGKRNIQSYFSYGSTTSRSDLTVFCKEYAPNIPSELCKIEKEFGSTASAYNGKSGNTNSQYMLSVSGGAEMWSYGFEEQYIEPTSSVCTDWALFSQEIFKESTHPFVVAISFAIQWNELCAPGEIKIVDQDWQKLGAMGVSIIVQSGERGSGYSPNQVFYDFRGQLLYPAWPAVSPYATVVGATSFVHSTGTLQQSAFFPQNQAHWSGGGFSFEEHALDYQQDTIKKYITADKGLPPKGCWASTGIKRGTPDVSLLGWNYQIIANSNPSMDFGGDATVPSFAAMITRLNWVRMKDDGKTLGFLNWLFYQNPHVFTDIVAGNNDYVNNGFGFDAIEGWDATTGLGVPNFAKMRDLVESLKDRDGVQGLELPFPSSRMLKSPTSANLVDASGGSYASIPLQLGNIWLVSKDGETLLVTTPDYFDQAFTQTLYFYDTTSTKLLYQMEVQPKNNGLDCTPTGGPSSFSCYNSSALSPLSYTHVFTRVGSNIESSVFHFPPTSVHPGYTFQGGEIGCSTNAGMQSYGFGATWGVTFGFCRIGFYLYNQSQHSLGWELLCYSFAQEKLALRYFQPAIPMFGASDSSVPFVLASPDALSGILSQNGITQTTGNCSVPGTAVGIANGHVFLMPDGLYDLNTCRRITSITNADAQQVYVVDTTFILVGFNATKNRWEVVSYDVKGNATMLVVSAPDGKFDNVQQQFFPSGGRSALLNLQGNQYMIEVPKEGPAVATPLGRIPSMAVRSYEFWTFNSVIHFRDGSFLIPHLQGGNLYSKESKGAKTVVTPVSNFNATSMVQVMQGRDGMVLYQTYAADSRIIISETFNPMQTQ